jgi:hypothetical protein
VKNDICDDCAPGEGNYLQGLAVQAEAFGGHIVGSYRLYLRINASILPM